MPVTRRSAVAGVVALGALPAVAALAPAIKEAEWQRLDTLLRAALDRIDESHPGYVAAVSTGIIVKMMSRAGYYEDDFTKQATDEALLVPAPFTAAFSFALGACVFTGRADKEPEWHGCARACYDSAMELLEILHCGSRPVSGTLQSPQRPKLDTVALEP